MLLSRRKLRVITSGTVLQALTSGKPAAEPEAAPKALPDAIAEAFAEAVGEASPEPQDMVISGTIGFVGQLLSNMIGAFLALF